MPLSLRPDVLMCRRCTSSTAESQQRCPAQFFTGAVLSRGKCENASTLPTSTVSAPFPAAQAQKWQRRTRVISVSGRCEVRKQWVGRRYIHCFLPTTSWRSSSCFTMRQQEVPQYKLPGYVAARANSCALARVYCGQFLPAASSSGLQGTYENSTLCMLRPALCSHQRDQGHTPLMSCSCRWEAERCLHSRGASACSYLFASRPAQTTAARISTDHIAVLHGGSCRFSTSRYDDSFSPHALRWQEPRPQQPPPTGSASGFHTHFQERQQAQGSSRQNILTSGRGTHNNISITGQEQREPKTGRTLSASPEKHFVQDALMGEGTLQYTKVSAQSGPDALFSECLDHLRQKRYDLDADVDTQPSPAIEKLTQNEREVVLKVLQRVDPEQKVSPRLETRGWYIDPFWDPFKRVEDLQQQVAHDLTEFARLIGAAEARRHRLLLRASLRRHYRLHDPLRKSSRHVFGSTRTEVFPRPHRVHERFWDPTVDIRVALKNNNVPISWRDLHVLHHFIGENGLILPRRTTHASRYQQQCIFKAISMARRMALFPYDWKPTPGELMPIMDPLQFLADELTARYVASGDLRAEAMVRVMLARYPELNYSRYLRAKALRRQSQREDFHRREQEGRNDFSRLLRVYKNGSSSAMGGQS